MLKHYTETDGRKISTSLPPNEKCVRLRTEVYACYLKELETKAFADIPIWPLEKQLGVSKSPIYTAFGFNSKNMKGDRVTELQKAILPGLQDYIQNLQKAGMVINPAVLDNLEKTTKVTLSPAEIKQSTYEYYLKELEAKAFADIPIWPLVNILGVSKSPIYTAFGVNVKNIKGDRVAELQKAILPGLQDYIQNLQDNGTVISPSVLTNLQITGARSAADSRGTYRLALRLTRPRTNCFNARPVYIINGKSFTHAQIQRFVQAKQEQVYVDNVWVDIPLKIFRYLQKCLNKWAKQIDEETYSLSPAGAAALLGGRPAEMDDILEKEEDLQEILDGLRRLEKPGSVSLPQGLAEQVHTYQEQGYQWLYFLQRHGFGGILADDMGVGKTLQTLLLLARLKQTGQLVKPALIVLPKTALSWEIWEKESARFLPGQLKILTVSGGDPASRAAQIQRSAQYDILLTSYPLLSADRAAYSAQEFSGLILDEAQYIRNPKTLIARTIKNQRLLKADWRLALTGTPIENSLYDLWSIFDFLMPGYLGDSQRQFAELFRQEDPDKLRKAIYPFILRRTLPDTHPDLPASQTTYLPYALSPEESNIYNGLLDKQVELKSIDHQKEFFKYATLMLKLCNHTDYLPREYFNAKALRVKSTKFQLFNKLLQEKLAGADNKIVVFSKWPSTLKIIAKYLQAQEIDFQHLYGTDTASARETAIRKFNADPRQRIFLCSLMAGSTGIPLTAANVVIHYDLWWNPAVDAQATARILRPGQTRNVEIYYLYAQDTIEEAMRNVQERKYELITQILSKDNVDLGKDFTQEMWQSAFWDEKTDNPE
ncbi:MAG: DEAD/DEAH box helicase [Candidatus Margulisbacteria bacterium]|jgi:superfamily II DNA or RNA helicase|nr:DEAD/DEAH box helicase [Candidatus Margulisiibacteriota bacterium]